MVCRYITCRTSISSLCNDKLSGNWPTIALSKQKPQYPYSNACEKYMKWRLQRELERKKIVKKFRMNQIARSGQGSCLTDTCSTNWLLPLSFVSFTCLSAFPKRLIMMASAPKPKNSKCCFKKDFRTYNIEHIWTFNIFRKGFSVN